MFGWFKPADQRRVHEFQGYLTHEQAVDALGQPDTTHAAVPQQGEHAVRAELLAHQPSARGNQGGQFADHGSGQLEKALRLNGFP